MKRLFLHIKRIFKKFWFVIFFMSAISLFFGIALVIVMTAISMLFFSDPVDVDAILENFTERELEIILSEEMDESVADDEYLELIAKYQSYFCPKKIDSITIWTGSRVTIDSYIYEYELKKRIEGFSVDKLRKDILRKINKNSVHAQRMVRTNRNMVFKYTFRDNYETFDIVISTEELRG
ncbi:MAG: hypothetical protein IJV36_02910 [Prevotella sp.]|nr:hypothetical protein [Prevotella sp.]